VRITPLEGSHTRLSWRATCASCLVVQACYLPNRAGAVALDCARGIVK